MVLLVLKGLGDRQETWVSRELQEWLELLEQMELMVRPEGQDSRVQKDPEVNRVL